MALSDVISQYWWIFLILGIIILFFIWGKLDNYTRIKLAKIFNKKVILILVFAGVWYYWHKTGGSVTIQVSTFWMPIFFLFWIVGYNFIGRLQYKSQQLITPNFHGSYAYVRYIEGYYVFAIDGFTSDILNWNWASRLVILREETVQFFDQGAVSIARVGQVSEHSVDPEINSAIETDNYFKTGKKQIFYGWFDDVELIDWKFSKLKDLEKSKLRPDNPIELLKKELKIDNPKVSKLLWLYKNQNKAVNVQTEHFDSTIESGEKYYEHDKRMKGKYEEKSQTPSSKEEEY